MKNLLKKLLSIYLSFKTITPNSILIIETAYPSGSNTKILYNKLSKIYKVDVIDGESFKNSKKSVGDYLRYIADINRISKYNYVICTHGYNKYNSKQIIIDLWHGIPIKSMMHMENKADGNEQYIKNTDYLITSSKLESTLMSACTHIPYYKHRILGSPRNDYLFMDKIKCDLVYKLQKYSKVLLYMPTFRQGYANRVEGYISDNIFYFDEFSEEGWLNFLEKNNYLLILKLHPMEEDVFRERYSKYDRNIMFLSSNELIENNIDLYQLLPSTDILLTDYSSIYFDYLLLDKPIIFLNNDIDAYRKSRGIMLEPYDFWTPGYKVNNQNDLIESIEKSFKDDVYSSKREEIKNIFHYYQDGKATDRLIKFIEDIIRY